MSWTIEKRGTQVIVVLVSPMEGFEWGLLFDRLKEEIFREPRLFFEEIRDCGRTLFARKFAYLFTCEYCFSHYVTLFFLIITRYKLLLDDWRGTAQPHTCPHGCPIAVEVTYQELLRRFKRI